ncbi:response regulator [Sphingobium algorifonticola]|uniref:Response regulator n=1 Tax=Sphingobium algorifonticola TaxID=2008318 RepID=A0A437JD35_9SPHN|nr:response regulator [Sphingobium algorifonticola]RVT43829.1 response regulator [Sphingobium algorifonticola]
MNERLRILYVDDEDDIRTIVEMALGLDPDIELQSLSSGAAALALLETGGFVPDIAMIDMMMPGMSGIELLEKLRNRPSPVALPIYFITASARSSDIARYADLGANGIITKPFDPMTLARRIRSLWRENNA